MPRTKWSCPSCRRQFEVPSGSRPAMCPACTSAAVGQWTPVGGFLSVIRDRIRRHPLFAMSVPMIAAVAFVVVVKLQAPVVPSKPVAPVVVVKNPQQIYESAKKSVASVEAYDRMGSLVKSGSGFVLSPGVVVTSAHVVAAPGAASVVVRLNGVETKLDRLKSVDTERDVAALSVPGAIPLRGNYQLAAVGSKCYSIGDGYGLEKTLTDGIVSGHRESGLGVKHLQTTAPMNPGCSGGPLLDEHGDVIGLITSGLPDAQGIGFAIALADVQQIVENGLSELVVDASGDPVAAAVPVAATQTGGRMKVGGALRGLTDVRLEVLMEGDTISKLGMSQSEMMDLLAMACSRCGISVRTEGFAQPREPSVRLEVSAQFYPVASAYAYNILMEIHEAAKLSIDGDNVAIMPSWRAPQRYGVGLPASVVQDIRNNVAEDLSDFVAAWKKANQ